MNGFISTKQAAEKLKISIRRVQGLIASKRLPAEKIGSSYAIREDDLRLLNGRKNGRPAKDSKRTEKDWNAIIEKFAGCAEGGPHDLSTNKKYMEGFGRSHVDMPTKEWKKLVRKFSGSVKGLPRDLSTNKKYLEGFGK